MKYKIVVCDHIHQKGRDLLQDSNLVDFVDASSFSKEDKFQEIKDAHGLITRSSTPVDAQLLSYAQKVKAIVRAGVGVDNVNIDECSKKGIVVMNVPTSNTIAAVELTLTHLLASIRNFVACHNELKSNIWNREKWYGTELFEKKLGIIGFGNIGSRVGIRAKSFGMDILVYDPYVSVSKVTNLEMEHTTSFDAILQCDIITIHVPKTDETKNMITKTQIDKMKDGIILINCARGGLVNEKDLYEALKSKKISKAGIDVFDKEPADNHPFFSLDNITITPHLGANTLESQEKIAINASSKIIDALRGVSFQDALNLPINKDDVSSETEPYLQLSQKIGYFASKLVKSSITTVRLTAYGEINKHSNALSTLAVVGVLKNIEENVNYVNARFLAKDKNIDIQDIAKDSEDSFVNKISLTLICESCSTTITGTLFDGLLERVISIDGFEVDIYPKGNIILFKNSDTVGVVGEIGKILANHKINIADLRLGRNHKKEALAVIIVDEKISSEILQELELVKACISLQYIEM